MYRILEKHCLNPTVQRMVIDAPAVARKCQPGQFIILRVHEKGERIPLTIADYNREQGTVTIIYQVAGKTTQLLSALQQGDALEDFVGPLGTPSHLEGYRHVAVIGGGVGCAIAYPQAKALHAMGAAVDVIAGFRSADLVILEQEMGAVSERCFILTDDGSYGSKGLVTDQLRSLLEAGERYDAVIAIGPLVMMKFVCRLTREYDIPTIVSMNPIMIDGTGMCGGCRLTVDGQTKFACVDGPDFDGHKVDFDEAIRRASMYQRQERRDAAHCALLRREVE